MTKDFALYNVEVKTRRTTYILPFTGRREANAFAVQCRSRGMIAELQNTHGFTLYRTAAEAAKHMGQCLEHDNRPEQVV